jgi:serine phosphatase RsbU (regulator of sigma subunit)
MPANPLAKLLKKKGPFAAILGSLVADENVVGILDTGGSLLWGKEPQEGDGRFPIRLGEQAIGWVSGESQSGPLADLVSYAAAQEEEKKSLAAEVLDRYRELNLLYHLSEALGNSPHPEAIARAALAEAIRIIPAESGQILLKVEGQASLQMLAGWGNPFQLVPGGWLVERVMESMKAELVEAAPAEDFFLEAVGRLVSIVCAPLKTEKNILGVILLTGPAERAFSAGELKLLNTIALQVAPIIELSRLHQVELEKARFDRELQMARQVQESLLPQHMPAISGWQFDRRWHPAHDVSGDFYDLIEEDAQRLGLVIGDITGHGMPASLFMVFVRSALRASIPRSTSPVHVLTNANRVICQESYQGLYATLFYASLDTHSGELTFVNAGHPPALFYRSLPDTLELLARPCLPLGIDTDTLYTHHSIHLEKGDFVLFYTDGMIEAENPAGTEFGMERLKSEVYNLRSASISGLLNGLEKALTTYTTPLPVEDDLTLMVVKRE